ALSGCDEYEDESGKRLGQQDGLAAQADAYLLLAGLDVLEGEAAEGGGALGVEEDQEPGDAVFGFEGVVVEEPARLLPSGLGVDEPGWAVPPDGGKIEPGQLLVPGPAHEVP